MKLGDRSLGISPQIWAVLEILAGGDYGFYGTGVEGAEEKSKNHDVFTYPFYNFAGRAYGFTFVVKSFADIDKPVLNFTITEAGGGDDICVIDWLSGRRKPVLTEEGRPEKSRMASFHFADINSVLEYVRKLIALYLVGDAGTSFVTEGCINIINEAEEEVL
jgi:hypothetical protein